MEGMESNDTAVDLATSTYGTNIERQMGVAEVVIAIIELMMAVALIFLNIIKIIVIPKVPDFNDISRVFYRALTVADLTIGITLLVLVPNYFTRKWIYGRISCILTGVILSQMPILSAATLCMLNMDRFFSIAKPLRYPTIMTEKRAIVIVCCTWAFLAITNVALIALNPKSWDIVRVEPLLICLVNFGEPSFLYRSLFIFAIAVWIPAAILITGYAHVIAITIRAKKETRRVMEAVSQAVHRSAEGEVATNNDFVAVESRMVRVFRALKPYKIPVLLTVVYMISWTPFTIARLYEAATASELPAWVTSLTTAMVLLNSVFNIFLYFAMNRNFRKNAKNLLLRCER